MPIFFGLISMTHPPSTFYLILFVISDFSEIKKRCMFLIRIVITLKIHRLFQSPAYLQLFFVQYSILFRVCLFAISIILKIYRLPQFPVYTVIQTVFISCYLCNMPVYFIFSWNQLVLATFFLSFCEITSKSQSSISC